MLLCVTLGAVAQEMLTVSGTVRDGSGEPIIGANVSVKDAKGLGAITNADGFYTIKVKQY